MMQSAEPWHRNNLAGRARLFNRLPVRRSLLVQPKMSPVIVVIANILGHEPFEMALVERDHVVEQIATAGTNETFGNAVLPRTLDRGADSFHAKGSYRFHGFCAECCVSVENQVARRRIERERLAQLLRHPGNCWMPGNIEVKDSPPVMCDDEEAIEHAEGQGRDSEEVHRSDGFTVIAQEGRPSFRRFGIPGGFAHPVQHSSFADVEAEHLQFAMDTRRAPSWVVSYHSENQVAQFSARRLSSSMDLPSRYAAPIQSDSGPMPPYDSIRINDMKSLPPFSPEPSHHNPKQFLDGSNARFRMLPSQDGELLPQGEVFQNEVAARSKCTKEGAES